jgi:carbamoyltransferase
MALADYSLPYEESNNPMIDFFQVDDLSVKTKYKSLQMYSELRKILWSTPMEQFAFFAQQTIEYHVLKLVKNAFSHTSCKNIALSGGLFSNIKINREIRLLENCDNCFVFPHMGDGGLALSAAMALNYVQNKIQKYDFKNLDFGFSYSNDEVENILSKSGLKYKFYDNVEEQAAGIIIDGEIIFWFQGRMEYGPRALGNRSILARPDSLEIKDRLNILLKKRVWFQPFCPSILEEDAEKLLSDYNNQPNYHMTMSYMVRKEYHKKLAGVINVDGSCRPQMVTNVIPKYYNLLIKIKKSLGFGVLLNTSFNIHGHPLICTPDQAVEVFINSQINYMIIENFLIMKNG